jgi:hypothetical protein
VIVDRINALEKTTTAHPVEVAALRAAFDDLVRRAQDAEHLDGFPLEATATRRILRDRAVAFRSRVTGASARDAAFRRAASYCERAARA